MELEEQDQNARIEENDEIPIKGTLFHTKIKYDDNYY